MTIKLPRRTLLAGALPLIALSPTVTLPAWFNTLLGRVQALGSPGLLRSYDVAGLDRFDVTHANCAYVYDNAVTGLALLRAGDREAATRLADALLYAQENDRFWHDGRLRNAYRAGASPATGPVPLPGWWDAPSARWQEDAYQAGTATGVLAWAMLLWIGLGGKYLDAANRAADCVEQNVKAPSGYSGGFVGFEPAPTRLAWVSTEHNIDLVAGFTALGRTQAASHAADFVRTMYDEQQGRYADGLRPDGSRNDASAIDANLWPAMAMGDSPATPRALKWVLQQHGLPTSGPIAGVDFNTDRDGIWLEGTAITALACTRLGQPAQAARLMRTLGENTAPSGLIYASSVPTLTTGLATGINPNLADFFFFRRPHIAATAWAALAAMNKNPFP